MKFIWTIFRVFGFSTRKRRRGRPPPRQKHQPLRPIPIQKYRLPDPPRERSAGNSSSTPHQNPSPSIPKSGLVRGKCHVIDGDTICIRQTKIRLAGIDAPELDQPWGQKSKWAMVSLCKGQVITARLTGESSYDRLVAVCFLPDGRDIAAELIKQGLALDWKLFDNMCYRHLEPADARKKLWLIAHR